MVTLEREVTLDLSGWDRAPRIEAVSRTDSGFDHRGLNSNWGSTMCGVQGGPGLSSCLCVRWPWCWLGATHLGGWGVLAPWGLFSSGFRVPGLACGRSRRDFAFPGQPLHGCKSLAVQAQDSARISRPPSFCPQQKRVEKSHRSV
jgi:hypothetical protein